MEYKEEIIELLKEYIDIKKKEEWISNLASKNASLENHIEFEKFNINVTAKEWLNEYI